MKQSFCDTAVSVLTAGLVRVEMTIYDTTGRKINCTQKQ